MATKQNFYPHFSVENNKKPDMIYAFPVLGFVLKLIMVIPVAIELFFLALALGIVTFINLFYILFTGEYWDTTYNLFLGVLRLKMKMVLFLYGLTDKYPGFELNTNGLFKLEIEKPKHPNKWFAVPLFGFLARVVLLIPYLVFASVLGKGSCLSVVISWFAVTFKKKYAESLYEFVHDSLRVSTGASVYLMGLRDDYPSFEMSMDHKTKKILLIIAGSILLFVN